MSRWDEMDKQLSASVDALLGERVIWRPMRKRPGGAYTGGAMEPDPARPPRTLTAVVSWRSEVDDPGTRNNESGGISTFDCSVDFSASELQGNADVMPIPRNGDIIEITDPFQGNTRVEIARPADDGSQRLLFFCTTAR